MDTTKPADCPYYLLSRVTLSVTSALKRGFAEAGVDCLKPAYLGVLMSLWQEDGLKVVELGKRAGLEPSTMTGLLDRMERDGLLSRMAAHDDRRVQHIHLTDAGKKIRRPVLAVVEETLGKVFQGIAEKDLDQTKRVLRQVLFNAQEDR